MQCYSELVPPTAISHSVSLALTSPLAHNLVIVKASILQIFSIKTVSSDVDADTEQRRQQQQQQQQQHALDPSQEQQDLNEDAYADPDDDAEGHALPDVDGGIEGSFLGPDTALLRPGRTNLTKLVLVAEVPVAGTVAGLARVALPRGGAHGKTTTMGSSSGSGAAVGGDALLIAYRNAKMVLATWDPERATLAEVSLHYFEKDEVAGAPWDAPLADAPTYVEVDPASRCVALRFGARNLGILPLKARADEDDDEDGNQDHDWDEGLDGLRPEATAVNEDMDVDGGKNRNGHTDKNGNKDKDGDGDGDGSRERDKDDDKAADIPYTASFVLRLPQIDSSLVRPVHLAFLHQYREPTFGVLSSARQHARPLALRHDTSYKVFTLDLQQRASTALLSVDGLPDDLFQVVPLPPPAGGALLVGYNELIHVDQSGRTNGVAVNAFAKLGSGSAKLALADQSDLDLRLERCRVEMLWPERGELLMVLASGRLAITGLSIDGRTVSGLSVRLVPAEAGGHLLKTGASCLARLGRPSHPCLFVGSTGGDSTLLGWTRKQSGPARRKPRIFDAAFEYDLEDVDLDDDDEDDLYGESGAADLTSVRQQQQRDQGQQPDKPADAVFRVHDSLFSIAPIYDVAAGRQVFAAESEEQKNHAGAVSDLHLALAVGTGTAGGLAVVNREIQPRVVGRFEFPEARGFWTMCVQKPVPQVLLQSERDRNRDRDANVRLGDVDLSAQFDQLMIVAKVDLGGYETSDVYALTAAGFEAMTGTEFEPAAGITVLAGTMGNHGRIVQVLRAEVRCYDGGLALGQIIPMLDEDTGAEPRVVSASIGDPYLLLVRDDGSVMVIGIDANNELDEMDRPGGVADTKWTAGCLYVDGGGVFRQEVEEQAGKKDVGVFMFLVSAAGSLVIYALPDLSKPVYVADAMTITPPYLDPEFVIRKGTARESVAEMMVADLGDRTHSSPYLVLRHDTDDLTIYEPVRTAAGPLASSLRFKKVPNPVFAKPRTSRPEADADNNDSGSTSDSSDPARFVPMRACADVGGYAAIFLPGPAPAFVLKSAKSNPRVVGLHGAAVGAMSPFHTEGCERGFIYADAHGIARVAQLPRRINLTALGVPARKIELGFDVHAVAHHPPTDTYVVAGSTYDYLDPRENGSDPDRGPDMESSSPSTHPRSRRGILKLISPLTWTVIHTLALDPFESVESMRTLSLEVSEETRERRLLVAVGLAISRGEDLAVRGAVLVLDVVPVIPFPDKPHTDRRLRRVAREDLPRGAVTAVAEVGSQGLMLMAQGQKCMVRGLKEDGSLLPVAFLDMSCHVTAVSELRGSGLCVMADALRGVWFAGYTEEPYRMMILGKSATRVQVVLAEFLPLGRGLVIVVADVDGDIHVLEFNPEDMKSIQGHHLLHRTTFSAGPNGPTRSLLLPSSSSSSHSSTTPSSSAPQTLLLTSPTGQISSITPLPDLSHRRLSALQTHLSTALTSNAGLSVKAQRVGAGAGAGAKVGITSVSSAGRAMVDAGVLARWGEVGAGKRAEIAGRAGLEGVGEVREVMAPALGWAGLEYF